MKPDAIDTNDVSDAAQAVPGVPADQAGPVFRAPWEAQAFALAVALHRQGLFTWREWAAALAEEIRLAQAAGDPDTGETYYQHWLAALERLVASKGVASAETQTSYRDAWHRAAHRTPHSKPIELLPQDFAGNGTQTSTT
jgi:nitrile hydratase accessory protein